MAAIVECISQTGQTIYFTVHNSAGQLWNTGSMAFENYNSVHWANYATSFSEQSPSGYYTAAFPAAISTAGKYTEVFYQQPGGSPTSGDPVIGNSQIYWTGIIEEQGVGLSLATTTFAELGSIPPPSPTLAQAIMLLYMSIRNSHSATSIQETISTDSNTPIGSAMLSDDGTTTTKGKFS